MVLTTKNTANIVCIEVIELPFITRIQWAGDKKKIIFIVTSRRLFLVCPLTYKLAFGLSNIDIDGVHTGYSNPRF